MRLSKISKLIPAFAFALSITFATHADWTRFRGEGGLGIAEGQSVPTRWSDTRNIKWQVKVAGPGSSSPIVVGDKVFLTCWTGYGTEDTRDGSIDDLKRHLICYDRKTGKELWNRAVKAKLPEERYSGMFTQHGYATHTPVSDGEHVFAFFGKSGVHAFDLGGKKLWTADTGENLDRRGWGSASSPIVYHDKLIVSATVEDEAMYAFDTKSGSQLWRTQAGGFTSTWGTPIVVSNSDRDDIVISVPYEFWGLNPENGKLRWLSEALQTDSSTGSAIAKDGMIYAMGERGGGSVAIRAGGKGDVTKSHIAWEGKDGNRIGTPILWDNKLFFVRSSIVNCRDARTGEEIYAERVASAGITPAAAGPGRGAPGGGGFTRGGGSGGRTRGGGGGRGGSDYASPVAANGMMYQVLASGTTLVVKLSDKYELVGQNKLIKDGSRFSSTPAISHNNLFIRSDKNLYCIGE
jgi:outer membrane protein assembly factor BamB